MRTLVKLWLNQKVNKSIKKEVGELTRQNTPDNTSIKVQKDPLYDKLLIVKFESPKERQSDLADKIMKSYSLYLDSYSDISIIFETKRKKIEGW